jgi:DNA polymerase-3 subunit delta'
MLIGHQRVISFFQNAWGHHSFSHCYCLVGQDQIGKQTLARYIATQVLTISLEQLDTHPDFFYIERSTDEKSGKRRKELTVEQARTLKMRLQTTSWFSGYRVVVIDEVELLNEEAGNALLKLLEEPPEKTIFFLLTTNDTLLLPTIRSRTQFIYLNLVPEKEIIQGLLEQNISSVQAVKIAQLAWGRPGRALHMAHDQEFFNSTQEQLQLFTEIIHKPLYEQFKIVEELVGGKKEESISRDKLDTLLELWIVWWREKLITENNNGKSAVVTIQTVRKITEARVLLQKNINPKLLFENIVLAFS